MAKLILIRGLPGSGKSTLAQKYAKQGYCHNETDMYFVWDDGQYYFDPHQLKNAHEWCQTSTRNLLLAGKNVVVSNTFSQLWEMQPYLEMPAESVFVIKCEGDYGSIHNVPEKTIRRMKDRWEDYPSEIRMQGANQMSIWLSYHSVDDDFDGTCHAWDCDPDMCFEDMSYDLDIDEEDDTGDWQVIVLDRFADRQVNGNY